MERAITYTRKERKKTMSNLKSRKISKGKRVSRNRRRTKYQTTPNSGQLRTPSMMAGLFMTQCNLAILISVATTVMRFIRLRNQQLWQVILCQLKLMEVITMSKQRKKHPTVVNFEQFNKNADRNFDKTFRHENYVTWGFDGKYRGTQFRGMKRWN